MRALIDVNGLQVISVAKVYKEYNRYGGFQYLAIVAVTGEVFCAITSVANADRCITELYNKGNYDFTRWQDFYPYSQLPPQRMV